jgi:ribonuclease HI
MEGTGPHTTIYTDGACSRNPGPGGWAVLFLLRDTARYLSGYEPHTTNNRMELYAAVIALQTLKKPTTVRLHTDSRYVHDGISKWVHSWQRKNWRTFSNKQVIHQDLWEELVEQTIRHRVEWEWVRGHSFNELNNFVDFLATQAIRERKGVDVRLNLSQLKGALYAR